MQRAGKLLVSALGRGQLSEAQQLAWALRSAAHGYATSAGVPAWAKDLPPQWQAAAKAGSSYRRKMQLHFNRLDWDGDGKVSWETDFNQLVASYGKIRKLGPGSPELKALDEGHQYVFSKFWSPNKDLTGHSTLEDMVRNMILANNAGLWKNIDEFVDRTPVRVAFSFIDGDGDGIISVKEFGEFWQAHKLKPEECSKVFAELDTDKDGIISREEYHAAFFNWFTTPHADKGHGPGKNLWGIVPSA